MIMENIRRILCEISWRIFWRSYYNYSWTEKVREWACMREIECDDRGCAVMGRGGKWFMQIRSVNHFPSP
jgi:hypothetical protein